MAESTQIFALALFFAVNCILVSAAPVNSKSGDSTNSAKSKKWYEESSNPANVLFRQPNSAFSDNRPMSPYQPMDLPFGHEAMMGAPFMPDKWSDLFLSQQQRSFLPFGGPMGVEKRRRMAGMDDKFLPDNYMDLPLEPGRLEWNFNRL
ncbi:hypothetical protein DdX_09797 [Ditylenchus destructor]|uniref:Uncharacterized protein n=1 Tax=Ditylenchus destructor TaxID=166010 RepID=A0AAD4R5X3_9BILA|nr:hypothetical protein DdX_09797 [Ditylenchus destructor]